MTTILPGFAPQSRDKGYFFFRIIDYGTTTLSSPNSAGSSSFVNVTHGLGYQPLVIAFVAFSSSGTRYPLPYQEVNVPTTGTIKYEVSMEVVGSDIITFFHRDITSATSITDYITYYIVELSATGSF